MRSVFGWDLPPGCTQRHIDMAYGYDGPCELCGRDPALDCQCVECPTCGNAGDPVCYERHGLRYTEPQLRWAIAQQLDSMWHSTRLEFDDEIPF